VFVCAFMPLLPFSSTTLLLFLLGFLLPIFLHLLHIHAQPMDFPLLQVYLNLCYHYHLHPIHSSTCTIPRVSLLGFSFVLGFHPCTVWLTFASSSSDFSYLIYVGLMDSVSMVGISSTSTTPIIYSSGL
jgi:hypothetical protein